MVSGSETYWIAIAVGAAVSVLCVLPFFIPFLEIQEGGFQRTIDESRRYSANLASYLASSAHAHKPLLELSARFGRWNEVLFPGGIALLLGTIGLVVTLFRPRLADSDGWSGTDRETAILYASLGALIFWATLGPGAGFYTALYHAIPLLAFLRAPSRFGVVIPLILGMLAALALARLGPRFRTRGEPGHCGTRGSRAECRPVPVDTRSDIPRSVCGCSRRCPERPSPSSLLR